LDDQPIIERIPSHARQNMSAMDPLALLDEPYTFTQYRPLLPAQFAAESRSCGLWLTEQELEAWHRVRLLVPFYRLARRQEAALRRRPFGLVRFGDLRRGHRRSQRPTTHAAGLK
jgi:hypothetical protein